MVSKKQRAHLKKHAQWLPIDKLINSPQDYKTFGFGPYGMPQWNIKKPCAFGTLGFLLNSLIEIN
jgi:hypothetical protein